MLNKKAQHHWQTRASTLAKALAWNIVSNKCIHCHKRASFYKICSQCRRNSKAERFAPMHPRQ